MRLLAKSLRWFQNGHAQTENRHVDQLDCAAKVKAAGGPNGTALDFPDLGRLNLFLRTIYENGCGCIAISGSDERKDCECWCFGGTTPPKVAVLQGATGPTTKIDVTIRGARASQVAVALSRALRLRLAIPTSLVDKRLNVRWKSTPIRTVIKRLGLVEIRRA
jgi:hypothetical protein